MYLGNVPAPLPQVSANQSASAEQEQEASSEAEKANPLAASKFLPGLTRKCINEKSVPSRVAGPDPFHFGLSDPDLDPFHFRLPDPALSQIIQKS